MLSRWGIVGAAAVWPATLLAAPQDAARSVPAGSVRTVQDALAALGGAGPSASDSAGRNMKAVPAGSPGDWFSPEDYPPEAIRTSRSGRVVIAVGVDSAGAVVTCRTVETSGTDLLDQRTCELAKAKGRFNPATDGDGRPIASEYRLPVRWALPDGTGLKIVDLDQPNEMDKKVETEVTFDADGVMLTCRVLTAKGEGVGDPCKQAKLGDHGPLQYRKGGTGVPVKVVQSVTYHVEPLP